MKLFSHLLLCALSACAAPAAADAPLHLVEIDTYCESAAAAEQLAEHQQAGNDAALGNLVGPGLPCVYAQESDDPGFPFWAAVAPLRWVDAETIIVQFATPRGYIRFAPVRTADGV